MRDSAHARIIRLPRRFSLPCGMGSAGIPSRHLRSPSHRKPQRILQRTVDMSAEMSAKPRVPNNCCFVLFGVTGDLAHRLVIPALYNLAEAGLLPTEVCVVGVTRRETPVEALHKGLIAALKQYATRPVKHSIADSLFGFITSVCSDPEMPSS